MASTLPPAELLALTDLITPTTQGIASRVLAKAAAGNVTLFAFDTGQDLSEHTAPFDAFVATPLVVPEPWFREPSPRRRQGPEPSQRR